MEEGLCVTFYEKLLVVNFLKIKASGRQKIYGSGICTYIIPLQQITTLLT